jgi:hypothetical protein
VKFAVINSYYELLKVVGVANFFILAKSLLSRVHGAQRSSQLITHKLRKANQEDETMGFENMQNRSSRVRIDDSVKAVESPAASKTKTKTKDTFDEEKGRPVDPRALTRYVRSWNLAVS